LANVSLAEIKTAIEHLSFEERAELAAWLHGWKDDEWDQQMKRDIVSGKLDDVLREVEEDIKAGRVRELP
jgi:DNA-binding transcriptional MerR regulator